MLTQCKPRSFAFQGCQGRKVTAAVRPPVLPAGQLGERDQGTAAGSLLRPDFGHLFRRQPAPAPLLRLRTGPLRRPQASASRHPAGPGHRRNAPAQASQDRCTRHGVDAPRQGRHGFRTPLRRGLRPRPRPTARVAFEAGRFLPSLPHPSWDPCAPGPLRCLLLIGSARPQLRKLPLPDRFSAPQRSWPPHDGVNPACRPFPASSAPGCEKCGLTDDRDLPRGTGRVEVGPFETLRTSRLDPSGGGSVCASCFIPLPFP